MVCPPRTSLGLIPNCLFISLFALAITAFLPASWFSIPQWRTELLQLGARIPPTHSPQPLLTLQWTGFLAVGLVWSYYILSFKWRHGLRRQACVIYAIAIVGLSAALIVAYIAKQRIPFWPSTERFGFFPNRNQTSNVLGLGGVMIYALGLQSLQENRRSWWWWPVSLSIVCWALIANYSRAGIILFFCGALALHLYWWLSTQERQRPLIAVGGLILLVALFLINGGATLARFGGETTGVFSETGNLRWLIYGDAIRLLSQSSIFGIGLGNFKTIFAFNRLYSASSSEALHPESDWLWLTSELGWLAPIILILVVCWWLKKSVPFNPGSLRLLRMAALIYGCGFLLHSFADVSGHRAGALWPALFFTSIAIHPDADFKASTWLPRIFRIFGLLLVTIGLWWIATIAGIKAPPTSATLERLKTQITNSINREDYAGVPDLVDRGLKVVPLDWLLYYKRGLAEVALGNLHQIAIRDFSVANYLNPLWPDLYLHEGEVWLGIGEGDLAFDVWKEGLQRTSHAAGFYSHMLDAAGANSLMRDHLRELADDNPENILLFLRAATPFEFQLEIDRLLSDQKFLHSFSPEELQTIFSLWYAKGNKLELAEILRLRPEWQQIAWKEFARVCADYQDYRQACEIVMKFDPPPTLTVRDSDEPLEKLAARFQIDPANVANGLALYRAQINRNQNDAALVTLQKLRSVEGSPKFISYLEAQLWTKTGEWRKAWEALARYEFGGK